MNESSIRKYAKLMNERGLTGLEITENDTVVRLERSIAAAAPVAVPAQAPAARAQEEENSDLFVVRSPMVGVFYSAPAENADPFVSVGDHVRCGETLCIIEAMKLMNEIPSEINGVVEQVCVKNGQAVDYGCELFRIRR